MDKKKKLLEEEEPVVELKEGASRIQKAVFWIVTVVAIAGGLFHMYTGGLGSLSSMLQTVLHWLLMFILVFLLYPSKRERKWYDLVLSIAALAIGVYIVFTWQSRVNRLSPSLSTIERVFGVLLILLVLEATRRSTGKFLMITALVFLIYAKVGPWLPGILYHKGYSIDRIISVLCYSENGVFGNAMSISSTFIVLFVLFGAFLNACNGGQMFIDIAYSLTGSRRGGPAKTAIVSSLLMGCISGSPVANVVTTGTFTIPLMKRAGYESEEACAVEAVASSGGQIMPPIMGAAAFIMADYIGIKYGQLCVAAFIPAMLYYLALYFIVDFLSVKKNLIGLSKDQLPNIRQVLPQGAHLFIPIIVLIACLIYGFSPMKTVFYAILLLIVVAQLRKSTRMGWKQIAKALKDGIVGAVPVAVSCAAAGIIVGIVGMTGLGVKFSSSLISLSHGNTLLALLYTALASIILGCGLPTTAVYIILASMAAPALVQMGIPVLSAHMFVFYFGCVSTITPPVALSAYAAAGIGNADQNKTGIKAFLFGIVAYIVPFMFVLSPTLLAQGSLFEIVKSVLTALIGVYALAAGVAGYLKGHLTLLMRLVVFAGGILLVNSGLVTDLIGIALIALVLGYQILMKKKTEATAKENDKT